MSNAHNEVAVSGLLWKQVVIVLAEVGTAWETREADLQETGAKQQVLANYYVGPPAPPLWVRQSPCTGSVDRGLF